MTDPVAIPGIVITSLPGFGVAGTALFIQPDGKILVGGKIGDIFASDALLARYNGDGNLDTTFDGDGIAITDFGTGVAYVDSLFVQADGKVVAVGSDSNSLPFGTATYDLSRYQADGSLDSGFGTNGLISLENGGWVYDSALQSDGKIVIAGCDSNQNLLVVRRNADGSLDGSFGSGGEATIAHFSSASVTIQNDGKVLVAGTTRTITDDFAIARFNADGVLDTSFGSSGILKTDISGNQDYANSVVLLPDGKIVVVGTDWGRLVIARYNQDGSLDSSFGTCGISHPGIGCSISDIALQADGKILIVGTVISGDIGILRINSDGTFDSTFNGNGQLSISVANDHGSAITIQDDGKILVAGYTEQLGRTNIVLVRIDPDGTLDATFGPNAPSTLVGGVEDNNYVVTNADDVIVDAGGTDTVYSSVSYTLLTGLENLTLTGSAKIDGTGNELNNILTGNDEDNVLHGGLGTDALIGGDGNDTYVADDAGDVITENPGEGTDLVKVAIATANGTFTLADNVENGTLVNAVAYNLTGNALDNTLTGNGADNVLDGGQGADSLIGGAGSDTYLVHSTGDSVTEGSGEGTDLVKVAIATPNGIYVLGNNIEQATLINAVAYNLIGNDLDNALTGNAAPNILIGNDGNDTLDGGADMDTLIGGAGNDTYLVDSTLDSVTEGSGEGTDLVKVVIATPNGTYVLGNNIEQATLINAVAYNLTGNDLDNALTGNAAANILTGGDGNDTLDGDAGIDTLIGGAGNDTYIVDLATTGTLQDTVSENSTTDTGDTLQLRGTSSNVAAVTLTLAATLENLDASATGASKLNLTGTTAANILTGNDAANALSGLAGNDTVSGGGGNDTLDGGAGNDVLDAGLGVDIVDGGTESDTLVLAGDFADFTRSRPTATDTRLVNTFTGEDVTVRNVESFVFNGVTKTLTDVWGNAPSSFADSIVGSTGDDSIDGLAGDDTLIGGLGNDTLNGGAGSDSLVGGLGDDTYVVDVPTELVVEAPGEGTDQVNVAFAAAGTYALTSNVENATIINATLSVNLTGNGLDNVITGNAQANILTGGLGNDTLDGGAGNDSLIGGAGNDSYVIGVTTDVITETLDEGTDQVSIWLAAAGTYVLAANLENATITNGTAGVNLTGNLLDNTLTGNALTNILDGAAGNDSIDGGAGNDTLIGGLGNDTLAGGLGDDVYRVDSLSDLVTENFNEGTDRVETALAGLTLAADVENLTYTGLATFAGTGNALANSIVGGAGNDTLNGGGGNDTLTGNAGNDSLIGGTGDDNLVGGLGDDVYVVDSTGDVMLEAAAGGTDRVETALAAYTLGSELENLTYTGSSDFTGTGQALNNVITGGGGNDSLSGNVGNDTLNGGAGNDTLDGGAGSDSLVSGSGDDVYVLDIASDIVVESANEGTDLVQLAFTSTASYTMTANVENLTVTAGQTVVVNVTGNDLANTIVGNAAANTIVAGAGKDTITGAGGNDVIDGGLGSDTVILTGWLTDYAITRPNTTQTTFTYLPDGSTTNLTNVENITFAGDSSNATLASLIAQIGSIGSDTLNGGSNDDTLAGGLGNDSLVGGAGNDDLQGGDGLDTLAGGAGNDILDGGAGNDLYLFGIGGGDDIIDQNDSLAASIDTIEIANTTGNYGSGETTVTRGWQSYNDLVVTVNSTDANGDDVVDHIVVNDFFLNDLVNTAGAIDQIRFAADGSLLSQTQILAELLKGTRGDDWLRGYANTNDSISGAAGNDQISGAAGNDTLDGGLGNDTLFGGDGNDVLLGGSGNDSLFGGASNDTLAGGGNYDNLQGGDGSDTYLFNPLGGQDVIADSSGDADVLSFGAGILATGTQVSRTGNDLLVKFGTSTDQVLIQNYFAGGLIEQFRFAVGGTWSSTAILAKVLVPTTGNDQITGYLGSELLQGLGGDDTLDGGAGNDTLTGGSGADRFVFNTPDALINADTITDFTSGTDKIALSKVIFDLAGSVGATTNLAGLTGNGAGVFSYDAGTGALSYDADGAGGNVAVTVAIIGTATHPALANDFLIVS